MMSEFQQIKKQSGLTLIGLMFWAILLCCTGLVIMKTLPSINEYFTIKRAVEKIATSGITTVPEIRSAFEKQKEVEYSIKSLTGKDLEVTKEGDRVVIKFAYNTEIELVAPVFLLIKYEGRSR
jgi:Domain of unknown function (DUF4845)